MAVKGSIAPRCFGSLDMRPDFGDDRGAKSDVGHKVAVHDIDV